MERSISLSKLEMPTKDNNLNELLQWFGISLGIFSKRDKDMSCFRVFITLLRSEKELSSDEIASKLKLTRGAVIHHINNLILKGIVIKKRNKYALKSKTLEVLLEEIHLDVKNILIRMKPVAMEIDKKMNR